jgi:hypothetical protein
VLIYIKLKGQCYEIFDSRFSTWISFPQALIISLGPFQIYQKFAEISEAQGAPPVSLTPMANGKKSAIRKMFVISFGHLWVVELAYRQIFFFKFILSCQQFDNCSHCLPPVSFTLVANFQPVSLKPVAISHRRR